MEVQAVLKGNYGIKIRLQGVLMLGQAFLLSFYLRFPFQSRLPRNKSVIIFRMLHFILYLFHECSLTCLTLAEFPQLLTVL